MSGLGPMAGQAIHFRRYAPTQIVYAITRFTDEVNRLYGVMNKRLANHEYLAGRYSIADMACVGWVRLAERQGQDLARFPHLKRWFDTIRAREAVKRAFAIRIEAASAVDMNDPKVRAILFGQRGPVKFAIPRIARSDQLARVQVCDLQRMLSTQPLRSAVF